MDDSSSNAEAELRAFMNELRRANIQGDTDTVANSITDDYIQTDINGYRQEKTTWLNEYFKPLADLIKEGKFHWDEFERTNLEFRFYGHCAIVTGELHAKGTGARPVAHTWVPVQTPVSTGHCTSHMFTSGEMGNGCSRPCTIKCRCLLRMPPSEDLFRSENLQVSAGELRADRKSAKCQFLVSRQL
jgi:ketosteroid isomerase-like protein